MADKRQQAPQKINQSKDAKEPNIERENVSATASPFALDLDAESPMSVSPAPETGPNGGTQQQS